jgi:predicted transcriptional regulator
MTDEELREEIAKGYADVEAGHVQDAAEVFKKFRKKHGHNLK